MARHEGRRASPAPGPGAGGHPAAGTAAIPTAATATEPATVPAVAPVWAPALTAAAVLALANEVCALYARAEVARALAAHPASDAEHATQAARAAHWDALVDERWPALVEAIGAALPDAAPVERFMPVRPLGNGHVELHAHDTSARRLVVLLSGAQALALGAHLTAYGAVSLDRTGQRLDSGLPYVKEAPPFTTAAAPTGSASPSAAHP
jgi:hypothetical protein